MAHVTWHMSHDIVMAAIVCCFEGNESCALSNAALLQSKHFLYTSQSRSQVFLCKLYCIRSALSPVIVNTLFVSQELLVSRIVWACMSMALCRSTLWDYSYIWACVVMWFLQQTCNVFYCLSVHAKCKMLTESSSHFIRLCECGASSNVQMFIELHLPADLLAYGLPYRTEN